MYGEGASGVGGTSGTYSSTNQASGGGATGGSGGSYGGSGTQNGGAGGLYGGGGAMGRFTTGIAFSGSNGSGSVGAHGAVRIIWGADRSFPSANVDEASSEGNVSTN